MPSLLEKAHQMWQQGMWLAAIINLRGRPQLVNAASVLRAQEWESAEQGQGWISELSAEVFANVVRLLVETGGDPPTNPDERALARAVARGEADNQAVIERTETVARRLAPSMDLQLARAANDAERSGLRIRLAGVAALLALPRVDVLRLRMELPPAVPDGPDLLGDKLQAAFNCPARRATQARGPPVRRSGPGGYAGRLATGRRAGAGSACLWWPSARSGHAAAMRCGDDRDGGCRARPTAT